MAARHIHSAAPATSATRMKKTRPNLVNRDGFKPKTCEISNAYSTGIASNVHCGTRRFHQKAASAHANHCNQNARKLWYSGGKLKGPVCRNTYCKAFATPTDKRGFVAPKFHSPLNFEPVDQCPNSDIGMVLGKMGHTVRMAARLCTCYEHLAHPLYVVMQRVVPEVRKGTTMQLATTALRPSAQTAHHGHITTAHAGNHFNRDVIAVGNAENAIARVLFELRKPQPDNARALKLAQAALMAVSLVGEVLQ